MNNTPTSIEETQLSKLLHNSTLEFGQTEKRIKALEKELKITAPRLTPGGARGVDQKSQRIKQEIERLKKSQNDLKNDVYKKVDAICKNSKPEIKERVMEKTDKWMKSDIAAAALELEKKEKRKEDLTAEQERFLVKLNEAKEKNAAKEKQAKPDISNQPQKKEEQSTTLSNQDALKAEKAEKFEKYKQQLQQSQAQVQAAKPVEKKEPTNVEDQTKAVEKLSLEEEKARKAKELLEKFQQTKQETLSINY